MTSRRGLDHVTLYDVSLSVRCPKAWTDKQREMMTKKTREYLDEALATMEEDLKVVNRKLPLVLRINWLARRV